MSTPEARDRARARQLRQEDKRRKREDKRRKLEDKRRKLEAKKDARMPKLIPAIGPRKSSPDPRSQP